MAYNRHAKHLYRFKINEADFKIKLGINIWGTEKTGPGFKEGWAITQRQWTKVTADTGVGDPKLATAEKGRKYLTACVHKLANFLTELHQTSNENLYV